MIPNQKRTLILASIIGTLFGCYDEDEKTKLHRELHARVGKGIRKQVKLFGEDAVKVVAHDEGQRIWKDTVDHFTEQNISIEAGACVLAIVNMDEKRLSKYYGLSAGKLGKWAKPTTRSDAVALEKASDEVAKYLYKKVSELYGIEVAQRVSVLDRIKEARVSA